MVSVVGEVGSGVGGGVAFLRPRPVLRPVAGLVEANSFAAALRLAGDFAVLIVFAASLFSARLTVALLVLARALPSLAALAAAGLASPFARLGAGLTDSSTATGAAEREPRLLVAAALVLPAICASSDFLAAAERAARGATSGFSAALALDAGFAGPLLALLLLPALLCAAALFVVGALLAALGAFASAALDAVLLAAGVLAVAAGLAKISERHGRGSDAVGEVGWSE